MDLFDIECALPSLEVQVGRAKVAIAAVYRKKHPAVIGYSGGKDSGLVLALALTVARELIAAGEESPKLVVTSSDTLVENPEITRHVTTELQKAKAYAAQHGIDLTVSIVRPSLMSSWQVKILSGRALPSYAGQNTDCSTDLKIKPQIAFRNKLFREWKKAGLPPPVTLLGTRYSESEKRALRMALRGENGHEPVKNKDGDLILSPICNFSTDSVWEYIGEVIAGEREAYTDFKETMRIYADAGGTSCAVVSDSILEGLSKSKKGGCGARTGCWCCQQAYDKSLRTMVETEPRYAYARGLTRLNEYIRAIRYDWSKRHWIGRTVKEGYLVVEPDTFHPKEVRRLARFMMQLDHDERQRAARAGERPMFEILTLEMLITVDASWSKNGLAKPFAIWHDLSMIESGIRFDIPEIEPVPESRMPEPRFLYVGKEWDSSVWDGLRDAYLEGMLGESHCAPRVADDGLWEVETEQAFMVDPEGAELFLEFEVPYLLQKYDQKVPPGGITQGFHHYLSLGTLSLSHSQRTSVDVDLKRTALKDRLGLTLDYKVEDVLSMSCRYADLPPEAREAWRNKATTTGAQGELL